MSWWRFGTGQKESLEEDEEILIGIYETIKTRIIPMINSNERTHALNNINIILDASRKITNKSIRSQLSQLISRLSVLVMHDSNESTEVIIQIQQIVHRNVAKIYGELLQEEELLIEVKKEIERKTTFFEITNISQKRINA